MAMKILLAALLVLLISIDEIQSKSLLERIQDDSDLSQVSSCLFIFDVASFQYFVVISENIRFFWLQK